MLVDAGDGVVLDDDNPDHADRYNDAIWNVARAALEHAADDDVVFGLCAGRRRTMTAMTSMAFQLLARLQDRCLDVRIDDRRAEGGSGFYFPEQPRQDLVSRDGEGFVAADVGIVVVDVQLPKLRGLLTTVALGSYDEALRVGQARVDEFALPQLTIDLATATLTIDGQCAKISASHVMWIAALALARLDDVDGEGQVPSSSVQQLQRVLAGTSWKNKSVQMKVLKYLLGEDQTLYPRVDDAEFLIDLGVLRAKAAAALRTWCTAHRPAVAQWLVPLNHKQAMVTSQQLPSPPDRIRLLGLPPP